MNNGSLDSIERHISTHTERSADDSSAVITLEYFLKLNGEINSQFAFNDKWPNNDGTFELVPNPNLNRRPIQNYIVQIKGTTIYKEKDGVVKYQLKDLAFPAYMCRKVSLDPGILFVILNPRKDGQERVFWKYMSVSFLESLDFTKDSTTINFNAEDEIKCTTDSKMSFYSKLEEISIHHSLINHMPINKYTRSDIIEIIDACDNSIKESINRLDILNDNRDGISKRILTKLDDLCSAVLLLEAIDKGYEKPNLGLALESSMLDIETKFLSDFYKGLQYIGKKIPKEGQSERLLLKYNDFLWQIRKLLKNKFNIRILENLEKFPCKLEKIDEEYYKLISETVDKFNENDFFMHDSLYYVQKKTPFFVGNKRYYEITLQLAGKYASKYNRITAYTKQNIDTSYSIKVGYVDATFNIWDVKTTIKVINKWEVNIAPACLNKLAKALNLPANLISNKNDYKSLMQFLTDTGISLLELIDFQEVEFNSIINSIFKGKATSLYKCIILILKEYYNKDSKRQGHNVIRYILQNLREENLDCILPNNYSVATMNNDFLNISTKCYPFENNPFIANLFGSKTNSSNQIYNIVNVAGYDELEIVRPYLNIRYNINTSGELYFEVTSDNLLKEINTYNDSLDSWEKRQGLTISINNNFASIDSYENETLFILENLLKLSKVGNKGQKAYNENFIKTNELNNIDNIKLNSIRNAFVNSRILLIYGAAGTGKTTLMKYISKLMPLKKKLFLTKTHTALQNLIRHIDCKGEEVDFVSINSFTKKIEPNNYDMIFIDECSTIDNYTMNKLLSKIKENTFIVMAGDVHQIESIEFSNWFYYAKKIIKDETANVELLSTWRTDDESLISLWNEVRNQDILITEKLVIDGPFSEDIGPNIFRKETKDEIILCLNYDGKFGLNNMNNYLQAANINKHSYKWQEWLYKVDDPILFNDSKRFNYLYNNLKGRIVEIQKFDDRILFTIDINTFLTEDDCIKDDIEFIQSVEDGTRIRLSVFAPNNEYQEQDDEFRKKTIVPFQLAYAVSIHKAQGLEYDSVKIIIPSSNSEKITHGIFYTAITRAKKKLKIFWSSETMKDIVKSFDFENKDTKSLDIVKDKLL